MAEKEVFQGYEYRRNAPGEPWVLVGPAEERARITPVDPYAENKDRRSEEDQEFQARNDRRAEEGSEREDAKFKFDIASRLRNELRSSKATQEYQTVIRQYASALNTHANPTGDQALITAYAKMLDPGSVVREQEFNTVAAGDSTLGQLVARLQKEFGADEAGLLRPEVRDRVRAEMLNLTKDYNASYRQMRQEQANLAMSYGIDPKLVVGEHIGQPYYDKIRTSLEREYGKGAGDEGAQGLAAGEIEEGLTNVPTGTPPDGGDYQDSYLGQGVSGINEGLASALGAPVDLTTMALNLVPQGINAVANTNIPTITDPAFGSDWFRDQMAGWGIYDETSDPSTQFVRRVGQSIGATAPGVGFAGSVGRAGAGLLAGAGGGVGAATAQQVAPGNPWAEMGGEVLGTGLTGSGLYGLAQRNATRAAEAMVPTVDELKDQAGQLYRRAEANGVTADPIATEALRENMRSVLQEDGRISPTGRLAEVYPKAKEAMQLVEDYAGQPMNPKQIQTVRKVITEGANSTEPAERRIASLLTETFDEWADGFVPELAQARDVSSRYLNAEKLERARELAGARAGQFSGSGYENALRTEYRGLDRSIINGRQRYRDDIVGAIENVSRGTPASNIARNLGRMAPTTPWNFTMSTAGPAAVGTMIGGPALGGAAALAANAVGAGGRAVATNMGIRNAEIAELLARNGGPIEVGPLFDDELSRQIAAQLIGQASLSGGEQSGY